MWAYFTDYCSLGCSLSFGRESSGCAGLFASKLPDDSGWQNSTFDSRYFYLFLKNTLSKSQYQENDLFTPTWSQHSITIKFTYKRFSENDMRQTKYTSNCSVFQALEVFLEDKNSHLIIRIIDQYLSSRLRFWKKKKHIREFIKDRFLFLWFPLFRNYFSCLSLVLWNQEY